MSSSDFSARVFARNPKEFALLQSKRLVIVGLGSVGSALAVMAARAGVGHIELIDLDLITPENISRHICDLSALGQAKTEAVAALIRRINPRATVVTRTTDFRALDPAVLATTLDAERTALIAATDSFECQSLVNSLALETGVPALFVGCWGEASLGEILYLVPGRTACFECYAGFRRETPVLARDDPRRYTNLDFDATKVPGQAGLWTNILVICGFAFQVLLALLGDAERAAQLLDDEHPLFLVNVSDFDSPLRALAVTPARVERGCAVCDPACVAELSLEEA